MTKKFRASKTYGHEVGLSATFRQWRAPSHCRFLHGYALAVHLEFEAEELDENGWVIDFGALKPVKAFLVETFDHKLLVATDDPEGQKLVGLAKAGLAHVVILPGGVGCEAFARLIFAQVEQWLREEGHAPRVRLAEVHVREHGANAAKLIA